MLLSYCGRVDEETLDEQITRKEWLIQYHDGQHWVLSEWCRRESGNPKLKSLDEAMSILREVIDHSKRSPDYSISIDRYRLQHFKKKKDVIPAVILLA